MSDDVLLIDGNCNFCNSIARWINKNKSDSKTIEILPQSDKELLKIKFSKEELVLIERAMEQAKYGTVVLTRGGKITSESSAGIRVLLYLKWYWKMWLPILWVIPKPVRNWGYRRIAKHRNRIS